MHISFLEYLADPATKEPLTIKSIEERVGENVLTGKLASSNHEYDIVNGIPRFTPEEQANYVESFGFEWKKWGRVQFESSNVGKPMQGHTMNMFERIVGHKNADYSGQVILDVGCGAGRFVDIVRRRNGRVIGIDYSLAVEEAHRNFEFDDNVLICQANALALPIRNGSVDGAFSIGVLHHTPAPESGFKELVQAVKADGWVAVTVYGKGGFYDFPTVTFWRSLFNVMKPWLGYYPPLFYAYVGAYLIYPLTRIPVLGLLLRAAYPIANLPDVRWRVLDTFDAVTPCYQSSHTSFEVFTWFKEASLVQIEPSNWGSTSYHARVGNDTKSGS